MSQQFCARLGSDISLRAEWSLVGLGLMEPEAASDAYAEAGLSPDSFTDRAASDAMAYIVAHRADGYVDIVEASTAIDVSERVLMFASERLVVGKFEAVPAARKVAFHARGRSLLSAMDAVRDGIDSGMGPDPFAVSDAIDALNGISGSEQRSLRIVDGSAAAKRDIPPPDTIVDGLFDAGDKVDIIAPSKCHKTWFTIGLAIHAAAGAPFLGMAIPRPRRVLYINLEIKEDNFDRRLQMSIAAYGMTPESLGDRLGIIPARGMGPETRSCVIRLARRFRAEVVVIDPQYKLLRPDEDENSGSGIAELLRLKDNIAEETGAAVVAVMHDGKGQSGDRDIRDRGAGSSWTTRDFDARVTLTPHAEDPESMAVVSVMCRNYPPRQDFTVAFGECRFEVDADTPPTPETSKTRERRMNGGDSAVQDAHFRFIEQQIRLGNGTEVSGKDIAARMSVQFGFSARRAGNIVSHFAKRLPEGISVASRGRFHESVFSARQKEV